MKAFVRLAIHANSGVLGVHLVHDLVPLCLRLANDKTMEQQVVCLLGSHYKIRSRTVSSLVTEYPDGGFI
jgi:hypothetical protein